MATSAFKSTTGRTPVGKSSTGSDESSPSTRSSSGHRRSRSLSRFSRPSPVNFDDFSDEAPPRGRFVNETRGSGVSDVSLDDLAVKFFDSADRGGSVSKFNGRVSSDRPTMSQRRGRSVSRHGSAGNFGGGERVNSESNLRRRRSVSVVRYQISDSESDADQIQNSSKHANVKGSATGNKQRLVNKTTSSNHGLRLKRSMSQKDLKYHDGYSSHSSVLTDDEGRDAYSKNNVIERTIRAVYAQKKPEHLNGDIMKSGLYEAMRKELRHAVKEITMELEQTMGKTNDPVLAVDDGLQSRNSTVRRSYVSQMEQSEKRKQDLLAEIVLQEQRGRELSQIIKELVPDAKNTAVEKSLRTRKRSNDRKRMSKRLGEEAERYIEDFISNVEDTDISSLDGERSDTSSTLGGSTKTETLPRPATSKSVPVHTDGVFLPWLKWETSSDSSPLSCNSKEPKATPKAKNFWNTAQDSADLCNLSVSSRVHWSPGITVNHSASIVQNSENKLGGNENYHIEFSLQGTRSKLDIAEYLNRQNDEDFLFERWNQQQRIHSGNLLLCNQMFFLV
ncbi:hypothetical protein K2173_012618 [Erythroxylum novogranatense]|uniref:Uncharacterized protein n=1 Tax=Erythroxylum novogranatense TaxID=1862640 RepID=A0AAV8S7A2_9ROSI|nr:hypothetical protein K2173_012618 [Erythroxylum novogranatense]